MSAVERWAPVVGWEGLYEVSTHGRVRSLARPGHPHGRYLTPHLAKRGGYLSVGLTRSPKRITAKVHRLVAQAFLGPCPDGLMVRHLDGNPQNPRVENLAYGTASENQLDTVRHGTNFNKNKTHCPNGHEYTPENIRYTAARPGSRYCNTCLAMRGNLNREHPAHPRHDPTYQKQRRNDPEVCAQGLHPRTPEFGRHVTNVDRKGHVMTQWICRPCRSAQDRIYRARRRAERNGQEIPSPSRVR